MAIKVNGTTVIDDSRNLVNIASGAGSSTTYGAVGTYVNGVTYSSTQHSKGDTVSGSSLGLYEMVTGDNVPNSSNVGINISGITVGTAGLSGTWRWMSASTRGGTISRCGILVRIS
jgi:hypothetical protein